MSGFDDDVAKAGDAYAGGSLVQSVDKPEKMEFLAGGSEPSSQATEEPASQSVNEDVVEDVVEDVDEDVDEDMDVEDTEESAPVESPYKENGEDTNTAVDSPPSPSDQEAPPVNAESSHAAVERNDYAEETEVKADESKLEPIAEDKEEEAPLQEDTKEAVVEEVPGNEPEQNHGMDDAMEESPQAKTEETVNNDMGVREEGQIEEESGENVAEAEANVAEAAPKAEDNSDEKPRFELPYSTRGRQKDGSEVEFSSRGYRDNTSDAGGHDVASDIGVGRLGDGVAPGASFLESMNEDERRMRTRFLPDVDGIRMLHKSEIKRDVSLARSIMSSAGVAGTLSSVRKARGRKTAQARSSDEDKMDVDEEEGGVQSEDERGSDVSSRYSGADVALESRDQYIFSEAFVAPPDNSGVPANGETSDGPGSSTSKRWQAPPLVVESITAFNPPRPPESVGPKQKNRMLRWERRPQDVENDLLATRKTVQKTREELHRAQHERERLEIVGSVLRTHFLNHLNAIKDESIQLNDELGSIQVDCVKAADLLTSRTRSRGAGKSVHVMRDVISVLKTRGASLNDKRPLGSKAETGKSLPGIGGVSAVSFVDWDDSANIVANSLAEAWILPGDKVETPYGEGVALHVFGPANLDVNEPPVQYSRPKPSPSPKEDVKSSSHSTEATSKDAMVVQNSVASESNHHGFGPSVEATVTPSEPLKDKTDSQGTANGTPSPPGRVKSSPNATGPKSGVNGEEDASTQKSKPPKAPESTSSSAVTNSKKPLEHILLPRVCVRLPFGTGFFPLDSVATKEDPSSYSDSMLAARWKKMVDVASSVGYYIDVAGMDFASKKESLARTSVENDSDDASGTGLRISENMDVDAVSSNPTNGGEEDKEFGGEKCENTSTSETTGENKGAGSRFLPLGAGMLATASSRGAMFPDAPLSALESGLHSAFYEFSNILGKVRLIPEKRVCWPHW